MLFTPLDIVTVVKFSQYANELCPIRSTLPGILAISAFEQLLNDIFPTLSTPSFIVIFFMFCFREFHGIELEL